MSVVSIVLTNLLNNNNNNNNNNNLCCPAKEALDPGTPKMSY